MTNTEVADVDQVRQKLSTIISRLAKDKPELLDAFTRMTYGQADSVVEWIRHGIDLGAPEIDKCFANALDKAQLDEEPGADDLSWVTGEQRAAVEKILQGEGAWSDWVRAMMTAEWPDWAGQDPKVRVSNLDSLISRFRLSMEELGNLHEKATDFAAKVLIPSMEEDKKLMEVLSQEDVEEVVLRVLQQ